MTATKQNIETAERLANDLYLIKNLGKWTHDIANALQAAEERGAQRAYKEAATLCQHEQNDCCYEDMDEPLQSRCSDAIRALAQSKVTK